MESFVICTDIFKENDTLLKKIYNTKDSITLTGILEENYIEQIKFGTKNSTTIAERDKQLIELSNYQ